MSTHLSDSHSKQYPYGPLAWGSILLMSAGLATDAVVRYQETTSFIATASGVGADYVAVSGGMAIGGTGVLFVARKLGLSAEFCENAGFIGAAFGAGCGIAARAFLP